MKPGIARMLAWAVLAAALLFLTVHLFSSNNLEGGGDTTVSTQR